MKRLHLDQDIKSMTEFRSSISSFIKQVQDSKRPLVITQNGHSAAVLLDVNEYERLLERLELFQEIKTANEQIENGQGISHEEAIQQILKVN